MLNKLKTIFTEKTIRNRVFFILGMLIVFRALSAIPVPGVNTLALEQFLGDNSFFQVLNLFSGGGLSSLSILMLGVGPYITASIIIQLMTMIFPRMKELQQEEGAAGRQKLSQYSRMLTVPLALIQTFSLVTIISKQSPEVFGSLTAFGFMQIGIIVVGASILLMWIGERLTEFGIGNGISLIIATGIISAFPQSVSRIISTYDATQAPTLIGIVVLIVAAIAAIIYITEAERLVEVTYARQARSIASQGATGSTKSYIPIRLNQAGVMPIIFALTLLMFPGFIANFMKTSSIEVISNIGSFVSYWVQNGLVYGILYFSLVFFFTYFYTMITFDPQKIAENLQRSGAFVPGIRPGDSTVDYLSKIVTRTTLVGALFLGLIAVLPNIVQSFTGIASITVGGTGVLIVVSTIIDMIKKTDAQIGMREY
ncbi:MAG: preprotein translocase subunit SecY [Patescibacteria group bacterium]